VALPAEWTFPGARHLSQNTSAMLLSYFSSRKEGNEVASHYLTVTSFKL